MNYEITDDEIKAFYGNGQNGTIVYIKDGFVKRYVFGQNRQVETIATRAEAVAILQMRKGVA